jgi:5,10-methylenetetrahydrofolate reductase
MRTAPQEAEDWLDWGAGVERGSPVFNKDSASVGGLQKNQIESVCVHACVHTCVCVKRFILRDWLMRLWELGVQNL